MFGKAKITIAAEEPRIAFKHVPVEYFQKDNIIEVFIQMSATRYKIKANKIRD